MDDLKTLNDTPLLLVGFDEPSNLDQPTDVARLEGFFLLILKNNIQAITKFSNVF